MATLLRDIRIDEISSVDQAANDGARIVLMKRGRAATKGDGDMSIENSLIFKSAQNCLVHGTPATFSKADFHRNIAKRAGEIKQAGETDAGAYTRAITADEVGRTLYKAMRFAKGPEVEGDATQDYLKPEPKKIGPAGQKMQALANDHARANPRKSPAGAYATVLTAPENAKLRAAVLREEMGQISSEHDGAEDRGVDRDAEERNEAAIGKAVAASLAKMPPKHLAYAATLDEEGRRDFLSMSEADRDRAIAANPNPHDNFKYPTQKRIYKAAVRSP